MQRILIGGAAGLLAAIGFAAVASADPGKKSVPSNFKYETDGKSFVRKGNKVTNPDGSWREEVPLNSKCVLVKEKTKNEYREVRECKKD